MRFINLILSNLIGQFKLGMVELLLILNNELLLLLLLLLLNLQMYSK